jgi:hypothetical protein
MSWQHSTRNPFPIVSVLSALVLVVGFSSYALTHQHTSQAARRSQSVAGPSMFLDPATIDVTPGTVITTTLYENSETTPVTVAQAALTYPADKVELLSISEGLTFTNVASTDTATPGLIRVARALPTDATSGAAGQQKVVSLNFTVLPTARGSIDLAYDTNSTFLVSTADNTNILSQTNGASFRVRNH